jgi:hypothetical protein
MALAVPGLLFLAASSYLTLEQTITSQASRDVPPTVAALERLTPGEFAEEKQAAGDTFARDPLNAASVITLSHVAKAEGNAEAAERLKLTAGDMMPRATSVQAEALAIFLNRRDFEKVMWRLDGLIRARPGEAANFFGLAAEISGDPDGSWAVARMIATTPPWRAQFFAYLLSKGQPEAATRIMDDLRSLNAPVQDHEIAGVVNHYLWLGDTDRAYAAWLSSLSKEELKDVKRIYDGGFRHPVRGLRFDWTVRPAEGLTYRLFPRNTASMDQTLQLDFQDFAGGFSNLSQILRLRPGRYRLSGEARFDGFASPTGLIIRLYCLDGKNPRALGNTAPLPQSTQWIAFDKSFEVPTEKCVNQILQLESASRLLNSQVMQGTVAIDALSIDALPPLAP